MAARAACLAIALAALSMPAAALAAPGRPQSAQAISRLIAAGVPVVRSHVAIAGTLRLPLRVTAPLAFEDVTFQGPVSAQSATFENRVSFRGSAFKAGADFTGATFDAPVTFELATSGAAMWFDDSTFQGPARFGRAHFREARFDSAALRDGADFTAATFDREASFRAAEFGNIADFTATNFKGPASFDTARFSALADFHGETGGPTSFERTRFEDGATFFATEFDRRPSFLEALATGDMVFDGTFLMQGASFSTVRFLGSMTFARSELSSFLDFDQAVLQRLDLDGAIFDPNAWVLLPTGSGTAGHVDELRFDPADARHFVSGDEAALVQAQKCAAGQLERCLKGRPDAKRALRALRAAAEQALVLAEAAAHRGGDVSAENRAYSVRQSLLRHDEPLVERVLNYTFFWGVGGYFVAPLHQVLALLTLLLVLTAVHAAWGRRQSPPLGPGAAFRNSWRLLWRLDVRQGTFIESLEAIAYKGVFVLLLMNLANVWPPIHDLLKGVLL